jgi:SAM-dependent methyltransferase
VTVFDQTYFTTIYSNYNHQNPLKKIAWYNRLVEDVVRTHTRPRILDIGCAFGRFLSMYRSESDLFGVDISPHAIRHAQQSCKNAKFAVSSAEALPLKGLFDVIVAFDVIEHVENLPMMFEGIRKLLSPEGCFIFVVPVYDGPVGTMVRLLDRDPTHIHKQSRAFWLQWASSEFTVQWWCGIWRILLPVGYYIHVPASFLKRFSPAIAVVCKKKGISTKG